MPPSGIPVSRSLWRSRYLAALAQLQDRISQPPVPVMAAGFTSNVDLAVPLNSAALARLLDGLDQPEEILRHGRPADPAQLMAAVLEVMAAGEGFDFPID